MNYIVLEIQTSAEGVTTPVAEAFADRRQAEFRYHTVLAYAAVSGLPTHAVSLLQSDGRLVSCQSYETPPESEPEPEAEPEPGEQAGEQAEASEEAHGEEA